jgi:hypothetical protein
MIGLISWMFEGVLSTAEGVKYRIEWGNLRSVLVYKDLERDGGKLTASVV